MKIGKSLNLRTCLVIVIGIFTTLCGRIVVGNDQIIENLYSVKINGVIFRNDVAKGILCRIKGEHHRASVKVYDNVGKNYILLSNITEGLDVNYGDSELLSVLAEMYKEYLNNPKNIVENSDHLIDTIRISRETTINERLVKIAIDINHQDSSIVHFMVYPRGAN